MKIIAALLVVFMLAIFVQMLYIDNTYPDYAGMIKQKNTDFYKAHEAIMTLYAVMESHGTNESLLTKDQQEMARQHAIESAAQVSIDSLKVLEQKRVDAKWSNKLLNALGI